jgi:hypothetical protein
MVTDLAHALQVYALAAKTHIELIRDSPAKGITGGSFFDAMHAQAAREINCTELYTLNVRHFKHVAPDLSVKGF